MQRLFRSAFFFAGLLSLGGTPLWASSAHKGLTFQGYLKDTHGNLVTSSGVTITSRLVSPNDCVLMSETHTGVNIADGFFTVVIGKGVRSAGEPGLALKDVFSNAVPRVGLNPMSGTAGSCNYTPTAADARKLSLSFQIGADTISADFNVRANAFSVWAESSEDASKLDGKSASAFLQTNVSAGLSQARLEEFIQSLTSVTGGAVRWNGANFVAYNPADATYLSSNSVTDTHIQSVAWSKLSAVPSGLAQIGGLSCVDGKILKRVSGAWTCADDDSGGGGGGSGTVTAVSSTNAYLSVANGSTTPALTLNVGAVANTVAAGDDTRFNDATKIHGVAIASGAPSSGNFLKYNGTNWDDTAIAISDVTNLSTQLGNKLDQSQMPASCAANQTLHFVSVTGSWTCYNIDSLNADKITAGTLNIARLPTGTTGSTVAIGNDSRFPASSCGSGNKMRWDGSAWQCETDNATDSTKVAKSGDTMTGALNLPSNGLAVGTSQLVVSGGNVGIGTASPGEKLEVNGNVKATQLCIGSDCRGTWPSGGGARFSGIQSVSGATFNAVVGDAGKLLLISSGATVNLPPAATAGAGYVLTLKRTGTSAVTIDADGGETIDGEPTAVISNRYSTVEIVSDGAQWWSIGHSDGVGPLYEFASHTFSNCGKTGTTGPALGECQTAYSGASWAGNTSYFNTSGGIQLWTAPSSGTYRIEVWGARGGTCSSNYGIGARMRGDFTLVKGQQIKVLVGQMGADAGNGICGGGGGTFVVNAADNAPLIIAGGGGGGYTTCTGNVRHGSASTTARSSGGGAGGTAGNGGGGYDAGGGGGFSTNGSASNSGTTWGYSFLNGGAGGAANGGQLTGGFGGGGGGHSGANGAGGGGGYSGGSGGYASGTPADNCGAGGGSYNAGSNQDNSNGESVASPPTNGQVAITKM